MARVAAIGLDSADWALTERLMTEGRMPNLARLRSRSVEILMHNDIVGKPEEAWASFLYGDAPYQAGYWSNLAFDPASYRSYRQGIFPGMPFYASDERRSLIFDVPKCGIRRDVHGIQVTGWGAHAASFPRASSPAGVLTELDESIGTHPGLNNDYHDGWYQPDYIDELGDALVDGSALRTKATRHLLERETAWDLFLTVLSEPHSGGHHFWHGVDTSHVLGGAPTAPQAGRRMIDVYEAVDATLGGIVEALPEDAVVVVFSVHGMQPNDSDVAAALLLPELLHRHHGGSPRLKGGDLAQWRRQGCPPVQADPRRRPLAFARDTLDASLVAGLRRRAKAGVLLDVERALRRARGRPPAHRPPWKPAAGVPPEVDLDTVGPGGVDEPATDYPNLWYRDAWPSMRAFSLPSFGEGRVRVNLRGRERDGLVEVDDYDRTCGEIEQLLGESINPRTGRSIAAHVERTHGNDPFDPLAPDGDLLITWDTAVDAVAHPTLGAIGPFPMLRMSEHSNAGFALISGEGIEPARARKRPTAELAPLILSLLDGGAAL
ncbi:MAG: alkaline phosphatase family protein [Actinobacteria bacterium]|nr:alkaline phosphatase family protein [Actinomycetota bacterium]